MSDSEKRKPGQLHRPRSPHLSANDPGCRELGGSRETEFNQRLLNDVFRTFWMNGGDEQWLLEVTDLAGNAMAGISPKNEHEGMIAAQIVASYSATMECFRRAAISDQTLEGRKMNLSLANKSARTFSTLTESLMKLRGETGKQSVHVHHHHHQTDARTQVAAEQAIVNLTAQGGGDRQNATQPHERGENDTSLTHAPAETVDFSATLRGEEQEGETVPVPSDEG